MGTDEKELLKALNKLIFENYSFLFASELPHTIPLLDLTTPVNEIKLMDSVPYIFAP
ncbi:hypothetical protein HK096_010341, partial [Nowakowskiella sp. JEL0078]